MPDKKPNLSSPSAASREPSPRRKLVDAIRDQYPGETNTWVAHALGDMLAEYPEQIEVVREVHAFRLMPCETCNGSGIVERGPDAYLNCPDCSAPQHTEESEDHPHAEFFLDATAALEQAYDTIHAWDADEMFGEALACLYQAVGNILVSGGSVEQAKEREPLRTLIEDWKPKHTEDGEA